MKTSGEVLARVEAWFPDGVDGDGDADGCGAGVPSGGRVCTGGVASVEGPEAADAAARGGEERCPL